jgi:hypothetical protein
MSEKYQVLVGLDYPPGKRAEPGDVVSDLPDKSVKWLLKQELVIELNDSKTKQNATSGSGK